METMWSWCVAVKMLKSYDMVMVVAIKISKAPKIRWVLKIR